MKRFYTLVSKHKEANGYAIHLDGKPVKTPSGDILCAVTSKLADGLVQEWAAQGEEIIPDTMPLTQLANTAQDRVSKERPAMQAALLKFLDTDLLCYRTDDHQVDLIKRQSELWDPWLVWFEKRFGEKLEITTGLLALSHAPSAHKKAAEYVEALDDQRFTAFQLVVPLTGSLILALAFLENEIDPDGLFACAKLEEEFKADLYNEDFYGRAPIEEEKNAAMMRDLKAAQDYLAALSS